ncbi:hypothetical protein [Acidocella sp.]|uniref:hypothetical protein n=1 Tax=Acidocella sp. TaxID=50710 RepID=UPI003CFC755C
MKEKINDALVDAYGPKKAAKVWEEKKPIKTTKDGEKSFIKFSANSTTKDGKPRVVALFDSKGNPVKREVNLGSGSIIRVNCSITLFPADDPGVGFYMNSVQIIKYVEYVPGGGFEADDEDGDGFVADEFDGPKPSFEFV